MSSVKRLKAKGRASTGAFFGMTHNETLDIRHTSSTVVPPTDYDYRKEVFAGLPPATTVRPMRIVKARVAAANEAVDRTIRAGLKAGLDWAGINEATVYVQAALADRLDEYKRARLAADAGNGLAVHRFAAAH